MIAGTWNVTVPPGFWEPLRRSAVENALGYLPDARGGKPVVTYISRQSTGRRLRKEDHAGLVRSLRELDAEGVCEVHVVRMEGMSLKAQIELVARTSVLVGVHGNGLTVSGLFFYLGTMIYFDGWIASVVDAEDE